MSEKTPPAPPVKPAAPAKPVQPEWKEAWDNPRIKELKDEFSEAILDAQEYAGEVTSRIDKSRMIEIFTRLKERGFTYLVDIAGVHYPEDELPLTVVYYLHHMESQERLRFKVSTKEDDPVPSVACIWKTADWMEREAYDLVGINFSGHPDLRRILTWEGFNGHPLRKDFPLEGIDTGAAIYPDTYPEGGGPVVKEPDPPKPAPEVKEN